MWYKSKHVQLICCRNWNWDEPSCGVEMCAVLYHQPSAPPDEEGHFLFQWNDDKCNSKNNFVCKYPEGEPADHRHYAVVPGCTVLESIESTKSEFYRPKTVALMWPLLSTTNTKQVMCNFNVGCLDYCNTQLPGNLKIYICLCLRYTWYR